MLLKETERAADSNLLETHQLLSTKQNQIKTLVSVKELFTLNNIF